MITKLIFTWAIVTTVIAAFFIWRYEKKECIENKIINVADTIYQTYYLPVGNGVMKGMQMPKIITPNSSIMLTGGINYNPNSPYSYDVGIMYFKNNYGLGYTYNPFLKSHSVKVGIRLW